MGRATAQYPSPPPPTVPLSQDQRIELLQRELDAKTAQIHRLQSGLGAMHRP